MANQKLSPSSKPNRNNLELKNSLDSKLSLRLINSISRNLGGCRFIQLLTFIAFISAALPACDSCENDSKKDAGIHQSGQPDEKEVLNLTAKVSGLSPEYDKKRYHVIGDIKGAKKGQSAEVTIVFEKDGEVIKEVIVKLTAVTDRGTAFGKAPVDPKLVEGKTSIAYVKGEKDESKMRLIPYDQLDE